MIHKNLPIYGISLQVGKYHDTITDMALVYMHGAKYTFAGMKITVGHWPFSDQFINVATYFLVCLMHFRSEGSLCLTPTTVNMLCCYEINKLGGMFTL